MDKFRDSAHLVRLAAVFVLGILAFVALRAAVIPKSFGKYGHYRGDALKEITSRPISYAGHDACEGCHPDVLEVKSKGVHAHVNCESCHGASAKHAEDPTGVQALKPDVSTLCARCHEANIAKPASFPQIRMKDHMGGPACNTCHPPHSPLLNLGGKR